MKLFKRLAASFCLLSVCSLTFANPNVTSKEFTNKFYDLISKADSEYTYQIESDLKILGKEVNKTDKTEKVNHIIYLGNAYSQYLSNPENLDEVLKKRLKNSLNREILTANTEVSSLVPVIKNRNYIAATMEQLKQAGSKATEFPLYFRELNDDLIILFAFDSEEAVRYATPQEIEKLNLGEVAQDIASDNIRGYYDKVGTSIQMLEGEVPVYIFVADETYEASALLTPERLEPLSDLIEGEMVVFVPARNVLLVVDQSNVSSMMLASSLADHVYSEMPYSISPYPYVYSDGKWTRLEL